MRDAILEYKTFMAQATFGTIEDDVAGAGAVSSKLIAILFIMSPLSPELHTITEHWHYHKTHSMGCIQDKCSARYGMVVA